jgi:hypothetical protein
MSLEKNHANAYAIADRIIGAWLSSESPGLVLSIDIGGSLFDAVARNVARATLHQFAESPSLVLYRSRLHNAGPQPRPSDIIDLPLLFGRVDGLMRIENRAETFESYSPQIDEISTHSIDSWAAGRPPLRHIHFGDPQLTVDQLAGASQSFEHDRPLATFYTSGLDKKNLLSHLKGLDYRAFDLSAAEVLTGDSHASTDFGWIAFPSEKHPDIQPVLSDLTNGSVPLYSEWQEVMERNAPARQQRSRSIFGLPASAPPLDRVLLANDFIIEDDCYPLESDGIAAWRWLGPRSRTRLFLPCTLPGIYQVQITVIASHLQSGLGGCRILIEGREVQSTFSGVDQGTIAFIGQLESRGYTGSMSVDVVSPGSVSPAGADPRVLRLNMQSITVSPWR